MRRGQVTVEFLLIFGASLALISILAASLSAEEKAARDRGADIEMIMKAESAARAIEAMMHASADMKFDFREEGIYHSVEGGIFHASYQGKVIEIRGVFIYDKAEPV
jgi:hypothetical protein